MAFWYLKGASKKERENFVQVDNDRTGNNGFKLKEIGFSLDVKKKFFIQRVLKHWNRFLRVVSSFLALSNTLY